MALLSDYGLQALEEYRDIDCTQIPVGSGHRYRVHPFMHGRISAARLVIVPFGMDSSWGRGVHTYHRWDNPDGSYPKQ